MTAAAPVFDYLCFLIPCLCVMRHTLTVSSPSGTDALHIIIINTQQGQPGLKSFGGESLKIILWNNRDVDYVTEPQINTEQLLLIIYTFTLCSQYKPAASTSHRITAVSQTHSCGRGRWSCRWKIIGWNRYMNINETWVLSKSGWVGALRCTPTVTDV